MNVIGITQRATTCVVDDADDFELSEDIGVTVSKFSNGDAVINITYNENGVFMLMLNQRDAEKLITELGKIIRDEEVIQ